MHQDIVDVHHHSPLGHHAAALLPLEEIHEDAGPSVYGKGSHPRQPSPISRWQKDEKLAGSDAPAERGQSCSRHLQTPLREQD